MATTLCAPPELWRASTAATADRYTIDTLGVLSPVLMERAALAVSCQVQLLFGHQRGTVWVFCGPGNNGGDGYAVARQLAGRGYRVVAVAVTDSQSPSTQQQRLWAAAYGVVCDRFRSNLSFGADGSKVCIVDAILGTGSQGAPRGDIALAIKVIASANVHCVVSVDLPTGVDADTGRVCCQGQAVPATVCVTFQRSKPGLHIWPGSRYAKRVVVADIGLCSDEAKSESFDEPHEQLIDPERCAALVSAKFERTGVNAAAHKGERGHVAILAGSGGTPGAAILVAEAALRCGAGLATWFCESAKDSSWREQIESLFQRPEVMVAPAESLVGFSANAMVVGPGLTETGSVVDSKFLNTLWFDASMPSVWDASGLAFVPGRRNTDEEQTVASRVITPHAGEAASMLARLCPEAVPSGEAWTSSVVQENRLVCARLLARATQATVVLKGEGSLIVQPNGDAAICTQGSSQLATAGSGDCLAGVISALLARGLNAFDAACVGVWLHAVAGHQLDGQQVCGLASDISARVATLVLKPDLASDHYAKTGYPGHYCG